MSVVHNTQQPESTLKKKSNLVCYHTIRESVAMGEIQMGHLPSMDNAANICTKIVPGGVNRKHLIGKVLHDLYEQYRVGNAPQYKSVDGHIWMYIAEGTENWLPFSE